MRKAWPICFIFSMSFVLLCAAGGSTASAASSCTSLSKFKLRGVTVVSAREMAAGSFTPPGIAVNAPEAATYRKLPSFCRVVAEAAPSADSRIAIEVWLPASNWNHKFRGQGNGGFAGSLDYRGMANSVQLGYASAGTDTGHKGEATDSNWALGHPEKVIDFGYRGVHEMAGAAEKIIQSYYGTPQKHAYFDACSDGGREALMEAQRFPEDFDGILAGAPANDWTHLLAGGLRVMQITRADPSDYIPPDRLASITNAVLKNCDARDGVVDGILGDPRDCHFNPGALLCSPIRNNSCFTAHQVQTIRTIYTGGKDLRGEPIFPGLMPSSEAGDGGWKDWVTGDGPERAAGAAYSIGFFQNMVYEDPNWDFRKADIDAALTKAQEKLAPTLNATDVDLSKFEARGGKLILYHGWLDPAISPLNTLRYYDGVISKMGSTRTDQFVQLYMIPGMQHCAGGPGTFMFGQLGIGKARDAEHNVAVALEQWVENGRRPGRIIATKLRDDHDPSKGVLMTRPLCPHGLPAKYDGHGESTLESSFTCKVGQAGS